MSVTRTATTRELASFLSGLHFEDLPDEAVERTKELFLDWVGSALAGKNARPVRILERFTESMGPSEGPSEILVSRRRTSPLFAALVNGAASHVVEQDDLHNASVFHPATVVFPAALAAAQQTGASGRDLISASVAGYETGVRVGKLPRPLPLQGLPHHRDGGHARRSRRRLPPFGRGRRGDAPCARFGRDASRRVVGVPGRRGGLQAAPHCKGRIRRSSRRLPRQRRVHRCDPHPEGRQGLAVGMSSDADPRSWSRGSGRSGQCRRPRSSSTPPAGTPHPPPTHCWRQWRTWAWRRIR